MQSYEYEYNGFTINFIDSRDGSSSSTAACSSPRRKATIAVQRASGFTAPEIRHSQSIIAGNHGTVDHLSYVGGRIITLEGVIHGQNDVETLELMEDLNRYWNLPSVPTPDNRGYSQLGFAKDGQVAKYVNAKIHSLPSIDRDLHTRNTYRFQVQFRCEDPRIYSKIEKTQSLVKAVPKSGFPTYFPKLFGVTGYNNENTIENIGNWAAPLNYTITNNGILDVIVPRLTNVTSGTYQEFNMTIAPSDSITIDSVAGTAVDQDGNNILKYETNDSNWLYVNPRSIDTFRLTCDYGNPTVVLTFNDTWISAPR